MVAGPSGALAYLRSYLVPFMALLIGATISQRIASAPVRAPYVVLAAATLVFLIVELAAPEALFSVVRIDEFSLIKWGEYFDPADFLNMLGLPIGGYVINRLIGPQLHPVSLGYFLLFVFALVLSPERQTVRLGRVVSALVLLLVIAFCSKGAFGVAVVLGGVRALDIQLTPARVTILALVYVVPLLVLATLPFTTAHIHMEGLKAGLSAMAAHPMGTGIGVGGNLSSENEPGLGYESFVGVLFTQLGAFGIAFLAFVLYVVYRSMGSRTGSFFGLGCMLILLNSLLQEEAFSLAGIFLPLTYLVAVGRLGPTINRGHSGVNLEKLSGPIVEARPLVD